MQIFKDLPTHRVKTTASSVRQAAELSEFDGEVVQLGPGFDEGEIQRRVFEKTVLGLVRFAPKALIYTAQPAGYVTFTIPLSENEAWVVNGVEGKKGCFFLNTGTDETEILATRRNSLIGRIPTQLFVPKYNALMRSDSTFSQIPSGLMSLPQSAYSNMIQSLLSAEDDIRVAETMAIAVVGANGSTPAETLKATKKYQIVSQAREWMQSSRLSEVRLSDLCRISGVSAPTLTAAFRDVTGLTPMHFVAHLRLAKSRSIMLGQGNHRGSIKNAALSQEFLQLGRFSAFYQSVYGELPSKALSRLC